MSFSDHDKADRERARTIAEKAWIEYVEDAKEHGFQLTGEPLEIAHGMFVAAYSLGLLEGERRERMKRRSLESM